jgi:hypothetical protein
MSYETCNYEGDKDSWQCKKCMKSYNKDRENDTYYGDFNCYIPPSILLFLSHAAL